MGNGFEDLQVWRRSRVLAVRVCKSFKDCRDFGFRDQITRSSVSVPSNIAEGAERNSKKEFIQFLGYARGSAGELRTQLLIAGDLGYLPMADIVELVDEATQISRMLFGLMKSQEGDIT
jgi:four helix bundle protein